MTLSERRLLECVLETYEETGTPVSLQLLSEAFEVKQSCVRDGLRTLEDCSLVVRTGEGVRPTITARELLALDIDDESILIVDACDGSE